VPEREAVAEGGEICNVYSYYSFSFDGLGPLACLHSGIININHANSWQDIFKGDQLLIKLLPRQDNTNREKSRYTYMPRVGSEDTIPVFGRLKTFHALHCRGTPIMRVVQSKCMN
jgi:hypothetical protein